jgi:hypothetical protein
MLIGRSGWLICKFFCCFSMLLFSGGFLFYADWFLLHFCQIWNVHKYWVLRVWSSLLQLTVSIFSWICSLNFMWSESSSEVSNWFFFASVNVQDNGICRRMCLASPHLHGWKGVDRREKQIWANWRRQFHVIGKFKWGFKLISFCLCKCARQRNLQKDMSGISSFARLEMRPSTGKADLSELEKAISRDRKVQVKF